MKKRMSGFDRDEVADLLAECHRRCCICHRFCGFKMETDHMNLSGQGGTDDIDNAIPVCFECHAEIHCYNKSHPRGRKFTERELQQHKEQWLNICKDNPGIFTQPFQYSDAGPLNSLIDELEYNLKACECLGSSLSVSQFNETLKRGSISLLEPDLKDIIYQAYSEINHLNLLFSAFINESNKDRLHGFTGARIHKVKPKTKETIEKALNSLMEFLQKG
ncbi:MAG: HNH endonuclease [Planctomycetota bacterium]|jgi:hypothetical protein